MAQRKDTKLVQPFSTNGTDFQPNLFTIVNEKVGSENSDELESVEEKKSVREGKRANELDGASWIRYSISIWSDIRKNAEELSLKHPAMFPMSLPERLIQCFTTSIDKIIIDPFAGVGSTMLAAQKMGRTGIGIELSQDYADIANKRLNPTNLFSELETKKSSSVVYADNSLNLLNYIAPETADFGVTSPPYWDILIQKRSADYKEIRSYTGDKEQDLGTISDYEEFIESLRPIFTNVFKALKPGKYFCVNVMDIRKKDRLYSYHEDIKNLLSNIGFKYDDLIIWDRRLDYNNMRPLGYPSVFRVNRAHEFILIFQKPSNGKFDKTRERDNL
ncbi:MAG TPA: DNA methyltransferase [Chloroflexia bacterium]|nr:DNA methyltransferase [Chloroflexia bacterium]